MYRGTGCPWCVVREVVPAAPCTRWTLVETGSSTAAEMRYAQGLQSQLRLQSDLGCDTAFMLSNAMILLFSAVQLLCLAPTVLFPALPWPCEASSLCKASG